MKRYQGASLTSSGLAIRLALRGGGERTVSYAELAGAVGLVPFRAGDALPHLDPPRIEDDTLHLVINGSAHELPLGEPPLLVLHNTSMLMTCEGPGLGLIDRGAVICRGDRVLWVGPENELRKSGLDVSRAAHRDLGGRLLTPGLVDCHAHPVFAGSRAGEFERRARGDHYLDIAREGGGIQATVQPTRAASLEDHIALCSARMQRALTWGTTTMEAKSGYDLSVEGELRLLRVAAMVDALQPVSLSPTLLGAHVVPTEFQHDREAYVRAVAEEMIPRAAQDGFANAVDVYCDEGAFTLAEMRVILSAGVAQGLAVKAHVGQFADLGGPQLLAELGGLSADHLEQVSAKGMRAMASAQVVATMLPGACVQLKMAPPPIAELRSAGVIMALGSDLNPGTSHSETLAVPMWLACTHFGMSVEEAWLGVTRHGARALGKPGIGSISPGATADFVAWDAETPGEIPYHFGVNLAQQVFKGGHRVI